VSSRAQSPVRPCCSHLLLQCKSCYFHVYDILLPGNSLHTAAKFSSRSCSKSVNQHCNTHTYTHRCFGEPSICLRTGPDGQLVADTRYSPDLRAAGVRSTIAIQGFSSELQVLQSMKDLTRAFAETLGNGVEVSGIKVVKVCYGSRECLVFFKDARRRADDAAVESYEDLSSSSVSRYGARMQNASASQMASRSSALKHSLLSHQRSLLAESAQIEMHVRPPPGGNLTAILQSASSPSALSRFASLLSSKTGVVVGAQYTVAPAMMELGPRPPPAEPSTGVLNPSPTVKIGPWPYQKLTFCGVCTCSPRTESAASWQPRDSVSRCVHLPYKPRTQSRAHV
jgi:hypothetical protein